MLVGTGLPDIRTEFERLLAQLDFELWAGDPAEIQTRRVKKPKTDFSHQPQQQLGRTSRKSGYRIHRIWIYDACCGTVIGW